MEILRMPAVVQMTGLCRTTIWRRVKKGQFPKPFLLGGEGSRCIGWLRYDIEAWLIRRRLATGDEYWPESLAPKRNAIRPVISINSSWEPAFKSKARLCLKPT